MSPTRVLIELVGEVALLMWGIHMVGSGVRRAFGTDLRRLLGIALANRASAFFAGLGVTAALQSSTATAFLVTSFSGAGAVDLVPALAVMLGANVGTTLITQLLSFDVAYIYPLLICAGVVASRQGRAAAVREIGQAGIGIGLMLLSLHLLLHTMSPVENSATLRSVLAEVTGEPLLAVGGAALFAWAAHSSVAAILFTASLAGAGLITPAATLAMVLGCNLGSALNPLLDALGKDSARLRVTVGNLATRVIGLVLAFPFLDPVAGWLSSWGAAARLAPNAHFVFNLAVAALFIGILPWMAMLLLRLFPDAQADEPGAALYLDGAALATPSVALANASREVLRMADIVETMLRGSRTAFHRDDREKIAAIGRMDDALDRLFVSVQGYAGLLAQEPLTAEEAKRLSDVIALAINLEHVGDIVEKNLMEMAAKRIEKGHRLSKECLVLVTQLHDRILENLRLALAVFISGDRNAARRLVTEKEQFRQIEREAAERHLGEIRSGKPDVIKTSALQLDITRDLKRIEAHIASTAYGLLEASGDLRDSRLRA